MKRGARYDPPGTAIELAYFARKPGKDRTTRRGFHTRAIVPGINNRGRWCTNGVYDKQIGQKLLLK